MMLNGNPELSGIAGGFFGACTLTLLFWTINIGLLRIMNAGSGHRYYLLRYLLSAVLSLSITYLMLTIYLPVQPVNFPVRLQLPSGFSQFRFQKPPAMRPVMPLLQALSIDIIVIVLMELVLLRERKQVIENENIQLRISNLEARHGQLLQQIHPHFLFNSLNTLRSLIHRNGEQAEQYLIKLSDILRYSVNNRQQVLVTLSEELELCINYLRMQQVRFGEALQFSIDIPDTFRNNRSVPVYSIQLLVENAIKHNTLTNAQPLCIRILTDRNGEKITVSNNLQKKRLTETCSGAGLANLAERYRLLGTRAFEIHDGNGKFEVTILAL